MSALSENDGGFSTIASLGWHVVSGDLLLAALRRCEAGESASMVYAELWANADHEDVAP